MIDSLKKLFGNKSESEVTYIPIGEKQIIGNGRIQIEVQHVIGQKTPAEQKIWELNHKASQLKDSDINAAIACLAEAQVIRPTVSCQYPILEYLRLPVFLQQAGRMAEAEEEFKKLLNLFNCGHEHAKIYDKMRLTYQREKWFDEAIKFGVMSLACTFIGIKNSKNFAEKHINNLSNEQKNAEEWRKDFLQGLIDSYQEMADSTEISLQKAIKEMRERLPVDITKLLKKAKKEALLQGVIDDFDVFMDDMTMTACIALGEKVAQRINNF